MKNPNLIKILFSQVSIEDPFFKSLREDYIGFDEWYQKKIEQNDSFFVTKNNESLTGILYLKEEHEEHIDITPSLPAKKRLKIGTFKIDAHGTYLGQYYISKILHEAIFQKVEEVYITIFPKHEGLIKLVERYGFVLHGQKNSPSGSENVYLKKINTIYNNIMYDYPKINITASNVYLLSIQPKWHTPLFGDSILKTENQNKLIQDVSQTNSIHKVYICGMEGTAQLKKGDIIVIYYATSSTGQSAWFKSVATSICTVGEYKNMSDYTSESEFVSDIVRYSVFTKTDLEYFYKRKKYPHIIKMMYNIPLEKRLTMQTLVEICGLNVEGYWGFRKLTPRQFECILKEGGVHADFIIN